MNIFRDEVGRLQLPVGWSKLPKVEREQMKKQYIRAKIEEFEGRVLDHIINSTIIQQRALDINVNDWRWKKTKSGLFAWQEDPEEMYVEEKPSTGFKASDFR